ncbi:uncharacterized protein [Polyergus mexicanus]|uniref:uncharacterized protein n=1 Tax=Polyergus mexicanus TaxID=615972 RepID=UPI0038B59C0A
MREEGFYMILPSNSSMRFFPENKTTCFTTELPQRIDLQGRWEVALTEILFPTSFLHIRPGEGFIRFINIQEFTIGPEKKKIIAKKSEIPSGIYSSLHDIIEAVNYSAKSVGSHILWQFGAIIGRKVIMKLSCDIMKCDMIHYVNFSEKLCRILGFDTHNKLNASVVERLPLWLFSETAFDIQNGDEKNDKIENNAGTSGVLPAWIYDDVEIYTSPFYVFPRERVIIAGEPASLLRGIPDKLFVYCDICEPYITGDVQSPLLRIVALDVGNDYAFASTQIKHFSHTQYIALRQTSFRTIEIDIRDQLGQSIPFEFGTLTVTLHFRRIE